ncbi:hypothetical protein D3C81_1988910 [compost metagenome]
MKPSRPLAAADSTPTLLAGATLKLAFWNRDWLIKGYRLFASDGAGKQNPCLTTDGVPRLVSGPSAMGGGPRLCTTVDDALETNSAKGWGDG